MHHKKVHDIKIKRDDGTMGLSGQASQELLLWVLVIYSESGVTCCGSGAFCCGSGDSCCGSEASCYIGLGLLVVGPEFLVH